MAPVPREELRQRSCVAKRRFPSLSYALEAAHASQRRSARPLRAYHCQFCNGFHLTSKQRYRIEGVSWVR